MSVPSDRFTGRGGAHSQVGEIQYSDIAEAVAAGRALLSHEVEAVSAIHLDEHFVSTVRLVLDAPGRILLAGMGTSGPVARRLAHILSASGTPALFLHPADALHGSLGAVIAGDLVLLVSKGGQSEEANTFAAHCKRRGASLVVLTATPYTALTAMADVTVTLPQAPGADPGGIIAMGSSLAAAAWGDALAWVVMRLRGYSWSNVLDAHPAGAVGHLEVEDVLRSEVT
jgi:D-arabinose 5-phosphate isomerase GutQ